MHLTVGHKPLAICQMPVQCFFSSATFRFTFHIEIREFYFGNTSLQQLMARVLRVLG